MKVTLQESLLYYDCELLFEAGDDTGQRYIAVHTDDHPTGCDYIVAPASREKLADFKAGKFSLRSLLLAAPDGEWYTARIGVDTDEIILTKQASPVTECADLPDADYFMAPTPTTNRRLIEDWLPIKEISVEAIREGGALAGHPPVNQLHVWWARRPLVASRATIAAALLNPDANRSAFIQAIGSTETVVEERRRMDEIKASGHWSNVSFSNKRAFTHNLTDDERQWFRDNLAVADPVVLDVTAGGGSIPFEAGRLGLRTIANELNPVATLILRATCKWPQKYGPALRDAYAEVSAKYLARVRELIADNAVYPPEPQDYAPDGQNGENKKISKGTVRLHKYDQTYLWSRTVRCPDCGNLIPLSPNWRLDGSGKGLRLLPDSVRGVCDFEIVNTAREQSKGTVAGGKATCPYPDCGATTPAGYLADEAGTGRMGQQLYCIVRKNQWQRADGQGGWVNIRKPKDQSAVPPREFRTARPEDDNSPDIDILLDANRGRWETANILPNEPVPPGNDLRPITYGMSPWRNMFSPRQRLAHGYCVQAYQELVDTEADSGYLDEGRKAAWGCIALAFDKVMNRNSLLSLWDPGTSKVASSFATHDFGMKWSFAEMPVSIESLGLEWAVEDVKNVIEALAEMAGHSAGKQPAKSAGAKLLESSAEPVEPAVAPPSTVTNSDARMLDLDDASVDAIVFDPPYHNNVNYAELSDFFYVWLKRTAGYALDDGLFADHLTDKVNEAIASPARFKQQAETANAGARGRGRITPAQLATEDYQVKMDEIFRECRRVIKPDGIMVVMFTHRSNDAWNAMTIGLMEAGFNITRTWPVKTEAESSMHIRDKAAARSTILLVCRPAERRSPKAWHEVAQDIAESVRADLTQLEGYGLSTVDTYLAAYGPALQVISENWGTRRETANPDRPDDPFGITPMDALAVARAEVIAHRAEQLTGGNRQALTDPLTWFYVLAQDGAGGVTMPFDEANLFARALGVELTGNEARRVLENKNGKVTLKAATERLAEGIISAARPATNPLDQVHTAVALADRQNAEAAKNWLEFNGHRWQDGEFRTTFAALRRVHKPGHPDEAGARALQALLYEGEQAVQGGLV